MLYDMIQCSENDVTNKRNLWDCEYVQPAVSGHCDPVNNAAGVICEPHPTVDGHSAAAAAAGRFRLLT